jgi:hypothetical protein
VSSGPVHQSDTNPRPGHIRAGVAPRFYGRPATAEMALIVMTCAGLNALTGCSGRGTFLSGGPTVGQLKTSLSHLEYENAQMKRDMAKLKQENRAMEDRLVQEQLDNGDLTAQLDNARNLIRDRGLDPAERARLRREGASDPLDDGFGPRTLPASRSTQKRRKPPVARIPGQIEPAPPGQESPSEFESAIPDPETDRSSLRLEDDLDHHTFYAGPLRWTPIANRAGDSASPIR